ncbi:hypothetical protein GCM10011352_32730 [Marinobacterium zhoushanense]|uniref:Membrane protein affecting hemolysin expression n=1 Tax=Marinobacterium zhoushanense TaxID=1679163 RepID=A0ABQ1KSH6_9GAMM|nr:hypothetical protein [Marinobacterium zhoushanense]GGC03943.1 hypothetical protein GCM10011352_32730 [Marinobacterium zhoushanense]
MDRPNASAQQSVTLRQLLPVAAVLLLCLALSAGVLIYGAKASAEQDARRYGQSLARSTAIVIQPLLLADDRISLNYLFNELNAQTQVNGLHLTDARKLPVAVAGEQRGLEQKLELIRGDETLGELTLWVDSGHGWTLLKDLLLEAGVLALLSIAAGMLTLWIRLRPKAEKAPDTPTADFGQLVSSLTPSAAVQAPAPAPTPAEESEWDEDPDALPLLDEENDEAREIQARDIQVREEEFELPVLDEEFDNLPSSELESEIEEGTPPFAEEEQEEQEEYDEFAEPEPESEDEVGLAPEVDTWLKSPMSLDIDEQAPDSGLTASRDDEPTEREPSWHSEAPAEQDDQEIEIQTTETAADRDDNRELVELLRPSRNQERMPPFTPSASRDPDSDEAIAPEIEDSDQVEFDDSDSTTETEPARPRLSIVPPLGAREEQLGLYTLEHELELMLGADEAGYLFLIDASSAHSENLEEDERLQLMKPYRTLANSVAHIYGGRVEPTSEGDLRLFFDSPKENDGHGINALCASMLFTYLYRHYNQQRIRQFKPVINLHLALVRGHYEKLERMLEEARFLTRTTESNELITHTALTEAPDLKGTLLEGADIRREDEDKVLLIRIAKSYQELLEKQARHLLAKLQSREEQAGG